MDEPFSWTFSLWAKTAPAAPPTPPLDQSIRADVCVIGGGYCGISAALHLAEQGADVVLLEAHEPGWGASGRNGGQVIPGLKHDPSELLHKLGKERGRLVADFAGRTADCVFDLIDRLAMPVPHLRAGWIQGAHSEGQLRETTHRAEQWEALGAPVQKLGRDEIRGKLGTSAYLGGWVDKRGGAIQPLAFARELARAAQAAGARLYGSTKAVRLEPFGARWRVETNRKATVDAGRVLVATNGYTDDLVPGLQKSIFAVNSFQIATEPLSDNLRRTILPEGQVCSDTHKLLLYFRLDDQGRLLLGGRGPLDEPTCTGDWAHLERLLGKLFPEFLGSPIAYRWGGRIAVTQDFLPHLHEPSPGLLVDIGCMGRGIGLQTLLGKTIARYFGSGRSDDLPLPVIPLQTIPAHSLNRLYLAAIVAWHRMTDGGVK